MCVIFSLMAQKGRGSENWKSKNKHLLTLRWLILFEPRSSGAQITLLPCFKVEETEFQKQLRHAPDELVVEIWLDPNVAASPFQACSLHCLLNNIISKCLHISFLSDEQRPCVMVQKFLDFFVKKNHLKWGSFSTVPFPNFHLNRLLFLSALQVQNLHFKTSRKSPYTQLWKKLLQDLVQSPNSEIFAQGINE